MDSLFCRVCVYFEKKRTKQKSKQKECIIVVQYSVNGVIFVASLIDYNGVLFEDSKMNAFEECLNLFGNITQLEWFVNSSLILFLNKDDLLRKLLQTSDNGLSKCFSVDNIFSDWNENEIWDTSYDDKYYDKESGFFKHDYNDSNSGYVNGSESSEAFEIFHDIVVKFLQAMFISRNTRKQDLTCHITTALHNKAVQEVFHAVHTSILLINLQRVGILNNNIHSNQNNKQNNKQNKQSKESKQKRLLVSDNGKGTNTKTNSEKNKNKSNIKSNDKEKTEMKIKLHIQDHIEHNIDESQLRVRSVSRSVDLSHTNTATAKMMYANN